MPGIEELASTLRSFVPLLAVLAGLVLLLTIAHRLLVLPERRRGGAIRFGRQLTMLGVTAVGIVAAVLALPISETTRGQLLTLLGLVLTAILTLSSTTFVANAMAGLMLRAVGNFRPGDFVHVGEQFGRVTERGLFHTEIQTEDRDLSTLPNLFLVTQPVTVVRASGTIVSAQVSLGYDLHHARIEGLLLEAARHSGLEEPFVQILALGDFSVTYRVAGFLGEVKQLLSARSRLRASVLDVLHGAGIEIVSPTFMNQRRLEAAARFVPAEPAARPAPPSAEPSPEALIFDKAERAASREQAALRAELEALRAELVALEKAREGAEGAERERVTAEIERRRVRSDEISKVLEAAAPAEPGQR